MGRKTCCPPALTVCPAGPGWRAVLKRLRHTPGFGQGQRRGRTGRTLIWLAYTPQVAHTGGSWTRLEALRMTGEAVCRGDEAGSPGPPAPPPGNTVRAAPLGGVTFQSLAPQGPASPAPLLLHPSMSATAEKATPKGPSLQECLAPKSRAACVTQGTTGAGGRRGLAELHGPFLNLTVALCRFWLLSSLTGVEFLGKKIFNRKQHALGTEFNKEYGTKVFLQAWLPGALVLLPRGKHC